MKLRLLALLSLLSTSLLAQVPKDTVVVPKDSLKVTPFVINDEKPEKKRKKKPQPDTTRNYTEEYNRDNLGFQWGMRAGINFNSFTTKEITVTRVGANGNPTVPFNNDNILSNSEMVMGYLGGIFIRTTRGSFYLQPEVFYNRKGGKFDILQSDGKLFKRVNSTYSVIDIPVLLGIRFRQGRIFAGPMLEFPVNFNNELLSAVKTYRIKDEQNNEIDFKKELFKRPSLGVSAGIGFEFNHFFIEGRFEITSPVNYNISYNNDASKNLQVSSRSLVLAIGFIK
ncbi:outer membrane beta-barrel protein [Emticicia sp. BO119]|uniref:outer membrane beta-barrel protein n=1 Tax=Emticicia sp. BO119 TaxID=2757768 RepID=UPI0015F05E3A|nr:outer membrane beta-barrel protein [Emticicia sp. BO119]MBA4849143.1 PorT family protein [Emticicia sp. BO119]